IPVRHWIRDHYTKLTNSNEAKCNYCNAKFTLKKYLYQKCFRQAFIESHADIEWFVQSMAPSSLPSTVLFMFKLKHCVQNVFSELCQYTYIVNKKFKYFVYF
ncbi:hypothetical protein ALC56_05580, partial [Trachymyrmex septentrionalis]